MLLTNELTKPEAFPQGSVCDWASAGNLDGNKEEEEALLSPRRLNSRTGTAREAGGLTHSMS